MAGFRKKIGGGFEEAENPGRKRCKLEKEQGSTANQVIDLTADD